ncbi:MAG TPA: AMP-binding protein [Streptosporangiaceae bacterium]|nr:AMP-binding protein [Streptosporangiaceae bacterium]
MRESLIPVDPARREEYYERGWWREETFLDDLRRAEHERPEAAAVIAYENGVPARTLSHRELAATVDRFAGALIELGVGPGDVVVAHLPNWWMLAPLYLACARIRAVIATVIPPFGGRELAYVLRVTSAKVCVVPHTYAGIGYAQRLLDVAPDTLSHRVVVGDAAATGAIDFTSFFADTPWEDRHPVAGLTPAGPDEVSHVVFTSGTTGQPKGVIHTPNTMYVAGRAFSDIYELGPDDVISIPHYLTHLAGAAYAVYLSVALGATCVMQDTVDMGLLLDLVAAHGVTLVFAAPMYMMGVLAAQRERPRDIPTLRYLNSSSAPIPPRLVAEARDVLGLRLDSNFGMSECGAITITRRTDPPDWAAHSDGSPVEWAQVRIDAPPGEQIGRLLTRGASQCLGYVGQRDAYAACLDADGWFDTGDTARDDGRGGIRITGRRADLIVRSNGLMVPTLEVESILAEHPAIKEVVLIGYEDPAAPGTDLACAVVVAEPPAPPTLDELTKFLDDQQVGHRDWPDRIEVVAELPRNAPGKVLRSVLRNRIEQGGQG